MIDKIKIFTKNLFRRNLYLWYKNILIKRLNLSILKSIQSTINV